MGYMCVFALSSAYVCACVYISACVCYQATKATLSPPLSELGGSVKWDSRQCTRELVEAQQKAKADAEAG